MTDKIIQNKIIKIAKKVLIKKIFFKKIYNYHKIIIMKLIN